MDKALDFKSKNCVIALRVQTPVGDDQQVFLCFHGRYQMVFGSIPGGRTLREDA